ncbi:hypothetical protein [Corynebacterium pseudodiphtheriticum]|uniref:hypothetical protein n=1 Tax=Corynebacterium pseudodiphtheriticum TaxID=37637 RepID=UPI0020BD6092|nr:hypothetical protein [Corynebacterium pseudodiphtheriticum]UQV55466.1 hypothetical protein L9H27_06660 [Corynebacterium pseudodiphtheriticum]
MSIPKSVNRTVKRRGLAIATAVAVAGSGIVGANYASGQDANGGAVTAAEENENQAPAAQEVFDREKQTIDARLTETKNPEAVAQEVAGKYKDQFSGDEAAFGRFEYQLEQKVKRHFTERVHDNDIDLEDQYTLPTWEEAFKKDKETKIKSRLIETKNPEQVGKEIANQYRGGFKDAGEYNTFEYKIEQETKKYFNTLVADGEVELGEQYKLPATAEEAFEESKEKFKEQLIQSQNPEQVGKAIANQYRGGFEDAGEYNTFEYKIEQETKKYFNTLVADGEVELGEQYKLPATAEEAFEESKEKFKEQLIQSQNPEQVGKAIANQYRGGFEDAGEYNTFEYKIEQETKKYFNTLVADGEVELGEQYKLPATAEEAFEESKEKFKEQLIQSQNPEQVGKAIANQYRGGFEDAGEYNTFEYKIEQETKKYFSTLVADGEVELAADYTTPSPKAYFEAREQIIEAELRSPDGAIVGNVEEVVNKHAELVYEQPGSNLHDEADKTAWKDGFRPLVEVKKEKLELAARSAELKQQREELAAELRALLPEIEKLEKLHEDLEQKAKDQDARDSELDAKAAELKKQQAEFVEELKKLQPEIEKLEKLHEDLEQKAKDQDARDSELDAKAAELKKQQAEFVEELKKLQPEIEKLEKLHEDLEQKAKDQDARDSELDAKAAELKKQQAEFAEELKKLQPEFEKLDKLNNDLQKQADEQAARQAELDKKEADLNDKASALDEREASVNQQREQLDAAAKGLLPRIDELDKLNNDLQKKADEQAARQAELDQKESELAGRDAELNAKTAELRKQQAEFVEEMKQLQPEIEKLNKLNNELEQKAQDQNAKESELKELAEKLQKQEEALVAKSKELQPQLDKLQKLNNELEQKAQAQSAKESELNAQEAKLKQQRDELTAKAGKLASDLQRLEQLKKELDKADQDKGDNKEQPKPGLLDGSSNWWNPSGASDSAKGIFGIAAGVGALGLLFGGLLQIVNYFTGAGNVQAQVRDALAKIGIRF